MKCVLLYSLDSPSCEVCLFDPGFFRGFNRDFTRGTAEVRVSWIRVAFAMMVSALIQFILGGSATVIGTKNDQEIYFPCLVSCCWSKSSKSCSWKFSNGSSSIRHEHANQYKHIQTNNRNEVKQYTKHGKRETKYLKTNSTRCNDRNGTKNAKTELKR